MRFGPSLSLLLGVPAALALLCLLAACYVPDVKDPLKEEPPVLSERDMDRMRDKAEEYLMAGSCVRAEHAFEAVVDAAPARTGALVGLGASRWCREKYRQAGESFEAARKAAPPEASESMAAVRATMRIIAAKRQADKALRVENRLPPPVPYAVAVVAAADAGGRTRPMQHAFRRLLNMAVRDSGLALSEPLMVAALAEKLAPETRTPNPPTSRRIARLTGASYALTAVYPASDGRARLTILPVMPEGVRKNVLQQRAQRTIEKKAETLDKISQLHAKSAAVARGLDYFRDKERLSRLLLRRDILQKRISILLDIGRTKRARSALSELQELNGEIETVSSRIKGFQRELFELELNVFGVTREFLLEEGPRIEREIAELSARVSDLDKMLETVRLQLKNLIPDSGTNITLPPLCSPLNLWREIAADTIRREVYPEDSEPGGVMVEHMLCMGTFFSDRQRLAALGAGLEAMGNQDYAAARKHFERCPELAPGAVPPAELDPDALADMHPCRAALAAYRRLLNALGVRSEP
jgi:tetratricopeptide (TPR) repeat protein